MEERKTIKSSSAAFPQIYCFSFLHWWIATEQRVSLHAGIFENIYRNGGNMLSVHTLSSPFYLSLVFSTPGNVVGSKEIPETTSTRSSPTSAACFLQSDNHNHLNKDRPAVWEWELLSTFQAYRSLFGNMLIHFLVEIPLSYLAVQSWSQGGFLSSAWKTCTAQRWPPYELTISRFEMTSPSSSACRTDSWMHRVQTPKLLPSTCAMVSVHFW